MDSRSRAISFANGYFALVDGLATSLENYLAEGVVLDWFGRIVKGRKNVSAFIEARKVHCRHSFDDITPIDGIDYDCDVKNSNRKRRLSVSIDFRKRDVNMNVEERNHPNSSSQAEGTSKTLANEDVDYLDECDLNDLFSLATSEVEIERSINRIKLEEEMVPRVKLGRRECGQGDEVGTVDETGTIKYVAATGEIEFSRKYWKRDAWDAYYLAPTNVYYWRRPCRLQIAYSERNYPGFSGENRRILSRFQQSRTVREGSKGGLPSLEEIWQIGGNLVPNIGDFGGYLRNTDFVGDRNKFLESLEMEVVAKSPSRKEDAKGFVFNYQIHLIVYENDVKPGGRAKMNFMRKFQNLKI